MPAKREKLAFLRAAPEPSHEYLAEIVVMDEDGKQIIVPISLHRTLLIATTGLSLMHNRHVWKAQDSIEPVDETRH